MTAQNAAARAEKARQELFSRYDELNDLWKQAEERLTKYHIPQPVSFTYCSYSPDEEALRYGCQRHLHLGIQKVKGAWRICHDETDDRWPDEEHWTPITECSAITRVQAVKHLASLEDAVVRNTEGFIPVVDEAIQQLSQFLRPNQSDEIRALLAERAKLNGKKD